MKYRYIIISLVVLIVVFLTFRNIDLNKIFTASSDADSNDIDSSENVETKKEYNEEDVETIYLAGGCFWGVEEYMDRIAGVVKATSGYANGKTENPSYEDVMNKKDEILDFINS